MEIKNYETGSFSFTPSTCKVKLGNLGGGKRYDNRVLVFYDKPSKILILGQAGYVNTSDILSDIYIYEAQQIDDHTFEIERYSNKTKIYEGKNIKFTTKFFKNKIKEYLKKEYIKLQRIESILKNF